MSPEEFAKTADRIRERIREWIYVRGLKDHEAAAKAGFSASYFSQLLTGHRKLKPEQVRQIAEGLNASMDWLLTGTGSADGYREPDTSTEVAPIEAQGLGFALIPLFTARAGAGDEKTALSAEPVNLLAFREEWIRSELRRHPRDLFLLTVEGDSMYPTLVPGEVVLVDKTATRVSADAIYLLRVYGGIMVKRAQLQADGLHLLSDNPAYERRVIRHDELESGVEILGRVIWGGRRY